MLPEKTNNSPTDDNLLDPSADEHSPRPNAFDNPTTEQTEQETGNNMTVIRDVFSLIKH